MEDPTARVMKEDTFRVGAGQVYPYRYYYGAIGLLKGLEVDARVTEIIGVSAGQGFSGYGNDKDKAMDLKLDRIAMGCSRGACRWRRRTISAKMSRN